MRKFGAILVAFALVVGAAPVNANHLSDDLEDVAEQISDLKDDIQGAKGQRGDLADLIVETDARLHQVIDDLHAAEADLAAVEADVAATAHDLEVTSDELAVRYEALQARTLELQSAKEKARERAIAIYISGGRDVEGVVFSAAGVTQLGVGMQYAADVMSATDRLLNRTEALQIEVGRQTALIEERETELIDKSGYLDFQRGQLVTLRDGVEARKTEVEAQLDSHKALLDEVRREISHFDGELRALQAEEDNLRRLLEEEQRGDSGSGDPSIFVRPVPGSITSPFGNRVHPIYGTVRFHAGVDMRGSHGTRIKAADAGRVILARSYGGYGNTVIIDHGNGLSTLYAHQASFAVGYGDNVEAGDTVGYVGSTGASTGAHLHFEVRRWGNPIDPVPFL